VDATGSALAPQRIVSVLWIVFALLLVAGLGAVLRVTLRSGLGILLPFAALIFLFVLVLVTLVHYWWRWAV